VSHNLARTLVETAAREPDRVALLHGDLRLTYRELEVSASAFADALSDAGVSRRDRVSLLLPNIPEYVAAYYGALRLGAVVVPLNVLLRRGEIEERLRHSGASVLVSEPERLGDYRDSGVALIDALSVEGTGGSRELADVGADDIAAILYTSGTTGDAKGAELTHGGMDAISRFLATKLLRLTHEDVILGAPPLTHILGQSGVMNPAIYIGCSVALVPRFDPEQTLDLVEHEGVSVFLGVPTMCIALLRAAESRPTVPTLRVAHVGASPVPVEVLNAFKATFDCAVLEGYGMTESSGTATTHVLGQTVKAGSVGTPIDGAEVRVVDTDGGDLGSGDIGEVFFRSPALMRGYWQNADATAAALVDGWFATGDMGYLDEDGYLYLVDRKKDVILRGGYTVYPREVEEALYEHPAVHEATVVGVPDELLGEEVVALVVPRAAVDCDPAEVREFVRERVAGYKYPRLVVVVDDLPRGPSGKILKRQIDRAPLRAALDSARAPRS
jgi:long-chain acyl-CoA synthetase